MMAFVVVLTAMLACVPATGDSQVRSYAINPDGSYVDDPSGILGGNMADGSGITYPGTGGGEEANEPVEVTVTIEPDDYADGAELTFVSPHVEFHTALDDNSVADLFEITASNDGQGLAPTGDHVFGHAGIAFFNNNRRLLMEFPSPAQLVQITFAGGTFSGTETGRLQAFDGSGSLLAEYVTQPRGAGEIEVMVINRDTADIAWALAYAEGDGSFGRLDALIFTILTAP
jgi:hypothetical protein